MHVKGTVFRYSGERSIYPSTNVHYYKSKRREIFREFCEATFRVASYDERYHNVLNSQIRSIFTTNIDNLVHKVIGDHNSKYLHDIFITGPSNSDHSGVDYFALHGCIEHSNREYVFGSEEIASAFGDEPQLWNYFSQILSSTPTIFWGYGVRDAGTLRVISNSLRPSKRGNTPAERWIVLHPEEEDAEDLYKAYGFSIIYSDTSDFLDYLGTTFESSKRDNVEDFNLGDFPEFSIPSITEVPVRSKREFFEGAEPTWYDILSGTPTRISHHAKCENIVQSGSNLLIVGVAGSGKTTLCKTLACSHSLPSTPLYIDGYIPLAKAKLLSDKIGSKNVSIYWDDAIEDVECLNIFKGNPNVQIIATARDYVFEFTRNLLDIEKLGIFNTSDIGEADAQKVLNNIPAEMRTRPSRQQRTDSGFTNSLFDVVATTVRGSTIRSRIRRIFTDLEPEADIFCDLFVLISYFHNTNVPASFDIISSYCGIDGIQISDVHNTLIRLGSFISEYEGVVTLPDQDYFSVRSRTFATACLENSPSKIFGRVLRRVHQDISRIKIPDYQNFKRRGFHNRLFLQAFPDWKEGEDVYLSAFESSKDIYPDPYILQNLSLYLASKRRFKEAFSYIDSASEYSQNRFAIRNTKARIQFQANITESATEGDYIYDSLMDSMAVLEDCYTHDRRKFSHIDHFSRFAIELHNRFMNSDTSSILRKSSQWMQEEVKREGPGRRLKGRLYKTRDMLSRSQY